VQAEPNGSFTLSAEDVDLDAPFFSDDKYLQPVIEDDALLFGIDEEELEEYMKSRTKKQTTQSSTKTQFIIDEDALALRHRAETAESRLRALETSFNEYKDMVRQKFLEDRMGSLSVSMAGAGTTKADKYVYDRHCVLFCTSMN
jgi:hypothetical protein